MVIAPPHPHEAARLLALTSYGVLDTPEDSWFDGLTALAARLCAAPMAFVSLVDERRQWFKSHIGTAVRETPRDQAICAHAILDDAPLVVADTARDPRFADNPLCQGDGGIRFYAGVPLIGEEGLPLGTLCVTDTEPRPGGLEPSQLSDLELLAGQVVKLLELERALERQRLTLRESVHRTKNVVAVASAIAAQTISESEDLAAARQQVSARLHALANAQSFLLEAGKGGAPLRALIERQLAAFADEGSRFALDGCEVILSDDAAEGISLAVHELATNAVKYGALSVPSGRVDIRWIQRGDGGVSLEWRESGGPVPHAELAQSGFGSVLVGALATQKIGGSAKLSLPPEGAYWTADVAPSQVMPSC